MMGNQVELQQTFHQSLTSSYSFLKILIHETVHLNAYLLDR